MNTFGRVFRVSLFGESRGPGIGVTVTGCPPGIPLGPDDFRTELTRRRPGPPGTSGRREPDPVEFLSGMRDGHTTGAPLTLFVPNRDLQSAGDPPDGVPRPGHGDFTLGVKWQGWNDPRGGGAGSGRLTVGLVLAGVVARRVIPGVRFEARVVEAGGRTDIDAAVQEALAAKDSVGGLVECRIEGVPAGLGEPFFDAVESLLAHVLLAIPAVQGAEFGDGFQAARMRGSEHNDPFVGPSGETATNHAGGVLGGITSGQPLVFRVAVKPAASIGRPQQTWDFRQGRMVSLEVRGRHDACIALRLPPVVEAAAALVLADLWLLRRTQVGDPRLSSPEGTPGSIPWGRAPTPDAAPVPENPVPTDTAGSSPQADSPGLPGGTDPEIPSGPPEGDLQDLEAIRREIDEVNWRLLQAFSDRGRLVQRMRVVKERHGIPMHSPGREMRMMDDLVARNPGPFPDPVVRQFFREVFRASLGLMEDESRHALRIARQPGQPDRRIAVGDREIGGAPVLIAGPCAVEDASQMELVASGMAMLGIGFLRGGAFKPRTSPYAFQGLGEEGLRLLREAGRRHRMVTVSEVVDPRHVDLAARYVDILQVGSRNMSNYELLKAAAETGIPVLLKRGFAATLEEFLQAAEYVALAGNDRILLCERGIRTFGRETRFTLDISAVPLLRQRTALPVLVDVSHAAGRRDILVPLARAALAAGAQGVMVEVHPAPHLARSDSQQQMDLREFAAFLQGLADLLPGGPAPMARP